MKQSLIDDVLTKIAKTHLNLPTLESRKMDDLDFSNQSVWQIKKALEAAFHAGYESKNDASSMVGG